MLESVLVVGLLAVTLVCGSDFPAPITKCRISDAACMTEQADKFMRANRQGIPALGVPVMEPFKLDEISLLGNKNSPVNMNLELTDVELYNYTTGKTTSFGGFTKDTSKPMKVILIARIPEVLIKAKYKVSGSILVLPLHGDGDLEWLLQDVTCKSKATFQPVERNGKIYLSLSNFKLQTKMNNVKVKMNEFIKGEKEISENILKVVNENWRPLSDDFTPKISEAFAKVLAITIDQTLKNVPYENYFLPDE